MKGYRICVVSVVAVILLLLVGPAMVSSRHLSRRVGSGNGRHGSSIAKDRTSSKPTFYRSPIFPVDGKPDTVQVAGSRLPDCSHACGSCQPCRLVMVSYMCATIKEAETCPMSYKCMCNNKSYPVP